MAKKNDVKKVSITQLENYADNFGGLTTEVELDEGVVMTVNYILPLMEVKAFVDTVVDACFDDEGDYNPEYKQTAIYYCIASLYGNVRVPSNVEKGHDLLVRTGICKEILNHVSEGQYSEILKAIDEKIAYRRDVAREIVQSQINEAMEVLESTAEMVENLFKDVNEDDIKTLIGNMDNFKIDEGKVIDAYIDREMNNR